MAMSFDEEKFRKRANLLINILINIQKQIEKLTKEFEQETPLSEEDAPRVLEIVVEEVEASELSSEMKELFKLLAPIVIVQKEVEYIV